MKKISTKRSLITAAVKKSIFLLLILSSFITKAQFMPANGGYTEYAYPPSPPPPVGMTTNSSNYGWIGSWPCTGGTFCWLLVSSWEGPTVSGISWQALDYYTGVIYDQGYQIYPANEVNLTVGLITSAGPNPQINVSYYRNGVGHFVDVWKWNCPSHWGGPGGITASFTRQLSCLTTYSQISMDSHKGYGTAIVWEQPGVGINVCAGNNNTFGHQFTIMGTAKNSIPDVAFTHAGSSVQQIHVASYFAPANAIKEYYVNWPDIIPGGMLDMTCTALGCATCPVPSVIEDMNPVAGIPTHIRLDAPDHYSVQNWAYTYNIRNDIYARIMNHNPGGWPEPSFGGVPATVCFTDGSYIPPGLPVINGATNDMPVIGWDNNNISGSPSFYVGWHTAFNDPGYNPGSDAYIAIQLKEGGFIANPLMPFSFFGASFTPSNISPTPTLAFSKQNDISPYLYETFSEIGGCGFDMKHRLIPWSSGSFKPGRSTVTPGDNEISINPNPFKDAPVLSTSENIENENITLTITDMSGKNLGTYNNPIYGANSFLATATSKLVPGNYLISVTCNKINFQKTFQVTKTD